MIDLPFPVESKLEEMEDSHGKGRRSRDHASSGGEEDTLVNGYEHLPERPSKRLRRSTSPSQHDDRDSVQDDDLLQSATSNDDVLPDSYRRSPRDKRRAPNDQQHPTTASEYQPGNIVRVSLVNFVTYTKAEFFPGPQMNMVVGPNGTGKSTLVCALCLGLGWSPKHLGRAKQISEFVKHGNRSATIEIELAADPGRHQSNPVIKTRIARDGVNADFWIDGQKSPKKHVQALAKSFNIQVDNLCQFLPQDRVAEFATLTPVRLLEATQRAAAPEYMSEWHEELKTLGRKQKTKIQEQQTLTGQLKNLDNRQKAQQADVDRLRQRSELQTRLSLLEQGRSMSQYTATNAQFRETKRLHRQACREVTQLQAQLQPNLDAVNAKERYLQQTEAALQTRKRMLNDHTALCKTKLDKYQRCENEMKEHREERDRQSDAYKKLKRTKHSIQQNIRKLEQDLQIEPPQIDLAGLSEQIREKSRQIRELQDQEAEVNESLNAMNAQLKQKLHVIERRKEERTKLQSQLGQQTTRLEAFSKEAARGWAWLQDNRHKFSGPVFGPVMLECSVKNSNHAPAVEAAIGLGDLTAFTTTNSQDYKLLADAFHDRQLALKDIRVRNAPDITTYEAQAPCSTDALQQLSLEGWIVDLLDGPKEVIAGLCDNNGLHQIGYTSRDLSAAQIQTIERSAVSSWITKHDMSSITRRRDYGDHAMSKRVQSLRPARCFTNAPVNREREDRIEREVRDLSMDCEEIREQLKSESHRVREVKAQLESLRAEKQSLTTEKDEKQRAKAQFDALPTKLEHERQKLADNDSSIAEANDAARRYEDEVDKLQLKIAQAAIDAALVDERTQHVYSQVIEAELQAIEAASDLAQLKQRDAAEQAQLDVAKQEQQSLEADKNTLRDKARELLEECQRLLAEYEEDNEARELLDAMRTMSPEQVETEIESTKAHLEMHTGGNSNAIHEYEERARKIEHLQTHLSTLTESLDAAKAKIDEIRSKWEPELDDIVGRISSAFADNFAAISCAGEVSIYKDDEDFEEWAIQIKVKFRETETFSILDSHRQSGGERSVSTIFYLMALQSLARAPFRVVDEINQGMDPRNERMVHSRLVSIACEARRADGGGGSQYFLITPKLLTGLEYHPNMKIHCIASGEWMQDDHSSLNFDALARKALSIRA